jgi:hypothetical protein
VTYPFEVRGKFPTPEIRYGTYQCHDIYDVYDAIFNIKENKGEVTWIGEKYIIGPTPNGKFTMFDYHNVTEVFV